MILARRPLAQSPRYLRSLSTPRVVPVRGRFATARFSSTSASDSTDTTTTTDQTTTDQTTTDQTTTDQTTTESSTEAVTHGLKSQLDEIPPNATQYSNPVFSEGSDVGKIYPEYIALTNKKSWALTRAGTTLYKTFFFRNYAKCLDFANLVGIRSKIKSHHPNMAIRANSAIKIYWTTHNPIGLSEKDIQMAKFCDEQASLLGGNSMLPKPSMSLQREEPFS